MSCWRGGRGSWQQRLWVSGAGGRCREIPLYMGDSSVYGCLGFKVGSGLLVAACDMPIMLMSLFAVASACQRNGTKESCFFLQA